MPWIEVPGFPTYEADEEGVISNAYTHRPVKYHMNGSGAVYAALYKDGKQNVRSVAPIIARLFLESPPSNRFDTPIHLDGDPWNLRADNLMWRPRWFAIKYHQQFRRPRHTYSMTIHLSETGETFRHPMDAAVKYGLLERSIITAMTNQNGVFPYNFHFWS